MFKPFPAAVCATALILALGGVTPTWATASATQVAPRPTTQTTPQDPQIDPNSTVPVTEGTSRSRSRLSNGRTRNRASTPPTPEEVNTQAQALIAGANLTCQVAEAQLLGRDANDQAIFEAACADGPGYILVGATPPQASSCIELSSAMRTAREADPATATGLECKIARNADVLTFIKGYAIEANVTCTIDDAIAVGKATNGTLIFEVGCAGQDGYRIDRTSGSWASQSCLEIASIAGASCRFTTPTEQAATVKAFLAGSEAASCDVQQARYMGRNTNGAFYEAKCAAGDGFVARLNDAKAVQQIYPCAEAAQIGGGCTLTASAAPAPAPAEAATPATPE